MSLPADITTPKQLETFLSGPAGAPPAGIATNFEDPPNLSIFVILTVALAEAAGSLAVLLRIYTKLFIIRSTAYEDYAVVLGWVLQIGLAIPSVISTHHGAGFHMWDIQLKTFFSMLYWTNVSAILYCPVVFLVKLSILLQYLRIFVPNRKGNMSLACVTSILRAYYASEIVKSHDISWNVSKMGLWTFAEVAIGTVVCCAPVLPKFFRHFGSKLYGTFSSKTKSGKDAQPQYSHTVVPGQKSESSGPFKKLPSMDGGSSGLFEAKDLSYPSSAMVKGDYLTVDSYDKMSTRGNNVISHEDSTTRKGLATKRDDLEK
ncbi:hypothetical protein G7Y79_00051g086620 [Physcia stellaris]|nr:hypothetical protein G7Y79_00051g086620 [Physcia stellaris]